MEKILENDEDKISRFPCGCTHATHCMQIEVEIENGYIVHRQIVMYIDGKAPLKYRILWAFRHIFRHKNLDIMDFILREEDIPDMINALKEGIGDKEE